MSNSGVVITDTEILVPLANESGIIVDLVDPERAETATPSPLATIILLSQRILLSHAHYLNLKKRQEVPEPLSLRYLS
jgi:hypothetical protein